MTQRIAAVLINTVLCVLITSDLSVAQGGQPSRTAATATNLPIESQKALINVWVATTTSCSRVA